MSSREIHDRAIALRATQQGVPLGASMGVIGAMHVVSNPAQPYHYGRWMTGLNHNASGCPQGQEPCGTPTTPGGPPICCDFEIKGPTPAGSSSTGRSTGNAIATARLRYDQSRMRHDGQQMRIPVPTQSGEPCEIIPVNNGAFTMFYLCCGGHCAPMPIVIEQPHVAVGHAIDLVAARRRTGHAECWVGVGNNNQLYICCPDGTCVPLPITFGPVPQGSQPAATVRQSNPAPTCDPATCKWICLPMPRPGDPHDMHCVAVPKEAQLQGAFFTSWPVDPEPWLHRTSMQPMQQSYTAANPAPQFRAGVRYGANARYGAAALRTGLTAPCPPGQRFVNGQCVAQFHPPFYGVPKKLAPNCINWTDEFGVTHTNCPYIGP